MKGHSYTLIITFVVLSMIGLALLPRLSVQLSPSPNSGSLTVHYAWPGVSPQVMEQQVTASLEGVFATLPGIRKVSSVSAYGSAYITLEIDKHTNTDQLRFEVAMLIRQLYPKLPKEVSYPVLTLNAPGEEEKQKPLMILQLNGNAAASDLQRFAEEQVKPRLAQTDGIYEINIYGGNHYEWVLEYDQQRLETHDIAEKELISALQEELSQKSLGTATLENGNQISVGLGSAAANQSFTNWVHTNQAGGLRLLNGRLVRLSDFVTVSRREQPPTSFYRLNGRNAVNLILSAEAGVNQIELANTIRRQLKTLSSTFPPGYRVDVEYDATEFIRENLQKIYIQTGAAVLILLLFVWLTSRSWRYTLLIVLGLVVNLALSFIIFYAFRIQIHLYSLAAITTSLGIIIDNTIVMIDHYRRYRNLQVFSALLGATLTTIAGLSVIWFLPDETRLDLADFALVMIITLGVSLAIALFFIPALMERWNFRLRRLDIIPRRRLRRLSALSHVYTSLLRFLLRFRKTAFVVAILAFGLPVFLLPGKLEGDDYWQQKYNAVFGNERYTEEIQPIVNKALGGTVRLFAQYVYEKSYYARPERTALYIRAGLPNQSTLEQMNSVLRLMETHLSHYTEIDRFITNVYSGQEGGIVVYFKPAYEDGSFPYTLKSRMIGLSTETSGITWYIYGVGLGFSQNLGENSIPAFRVVMHGYNYHELEQQAHRLKQRLEAHPRIQQVDINTTPNFWQQRNLYEYNLEADAHHLVMRDISPNTLSESLSTQNVRSQPDLYQFIDGDYEPVKVVPVQNRNFDVWRLKYEPIRLDSQQVKLADFTKVSRQQVSPNVYKEDQQYVRIVAFEYVGGATFGEKLLNKTLKEMHGVMPLGYTARNMDYNWFRDNTRTQYELLALVIVLIYIICAIIFESMRQPFALIMLIPLSFIGVFLAFY